MRVALLTAGSRGDVQPYVGLGRGLRRLGHTVVVAAPDGWGELVTASGLSHGAVPQPQSSLTGGRRWQRWQRSGGRPDRYAAGFLQASRAARPLIDAMLDAFWRVCRDADAVVSSSSAFTGPAIAQALDIPHAWALLQPWTLSRSRPLFLVPDRIRMGPRLNAATYLLAERIYERLFREAADAWSRATLGIPLPRGSDPHGFFQPASATVAYGISPHVVAPPPDWPANVTMCGFWFLDAPAGWTPDRPLEAFLDAGPPPMVVHLSAISDHAGADVLPIVVEALHRAGQRGVLLTGARPDLTVPSSGEVIAVPSVPLEWLLPRAAGAVHHGGAGTTASALRAGIPSVGVPGFFDQPFWSRRIAAVGAGPEPLPARRLTVDALAAAMRRMATEQGMRHRARVLGRVISAEHGVEDASRLLHRRLTRVATRSRRFA